MAVVAHVGFPDVCLWLVQSTKVAPRVDVFLAKVVLGSRGQVAVGQISRSNNRALGTNGFLRAVVVILDVVIIVVLQGDFIVVRGAKRPTVIMIIVVILAVLFVLVTTMRVVELTLLIKVVISRVATWAAKGTNPRRPTVVLL